MAGHIDVYWRKRHIALCNRMKVGSGASITAFACRPNPVALLASRASHWNRTFSTLTIPQSRNPKARKFFPRHIGHIHIENRARPQHKRALAFEKHAHNSGSRIIMITTLAHQRDGNSWQPKVAALRGCSNGAGIDNIVT